MHVDVVMAERRQPCDVLIPYGKTVLTQLIQCRLHVDGVPQDDDVEHQAQRAQLVLLTLLIALPEFAAFSVKNGARHTVTPLATVELGQRATPLRLIVNIGVVSENGK